MLKRLSTLPPLQSDRLHLRALHASDAVSFHAMTDDPSIIDTVHILARPFGVAEARALLAGPGDGRDRFHGVWRKGTTELIGAIGAHLHGCDEIEIGYWFAVSARGVGLASEAVRSLALALAAAHPECRIVAECRPENHASWRLLEGVGFRASGTRGTRPGRLQLVLSSSDTPSQATVSSVHLRLR